jgi:uncharacterized protein (DUF608 family)
MHHTLDMELFSPDPWLTGFYLGALKAGAEMAQAVGEGETAQHYQALFEKGRQWVKENLFNGEYFQQKIDLADRQLVADQGVLSGVLEVNSQDENVYWDEEYQEIKYQIGEGSGIDQLLAQWHANLYGLGELFDPEQARLALRSIYRYNFQHSLRDHFNPHRIYSLNDEGGLLVCAYPAGKKRPVFPIPYAHESWPGVEYAAAAQMLQNGMLEECLAVLKIVRARYDGEKRNPWNEIECGSNYARSMSSYSLLNAYSGFQFDLTQGMIGFAPIEGRPQPFRCFWSLDPAWGAMAIGASWAELEILGGSLTLRKLRLPPIHANQLMQATLAGQVVPLQTSQGELNFSKALVISAGQTLVLRWED